MHTFNGVSAGREHAELEALYERLEALLADCEEGETLL